MRVFVIDDENIILKGTANQVRKARPEAEILSFDSPLQAIGTIQEGKVPDVVFLDIQMEEMSGIEAATQMSKLSDRINFIFTTGYTDYMKEAFDLYASGYILKPISLKKVMSALDHLRYPIEEEVGHDQEDAFGQGVAVQKDGKKLLVKTFGNFDVYLDGEALRFEYAKEKELLAYLIDRNGTMVSNGELMEALWDEEEDHYSYLARIRRSLAQLLEEKGMTGCLRTQRGGIAVNPESLDCDYYRLLAGDQEAIMAYSGVYMGAYSWAEYTNAQIQRKLGTL